MTVLTSRSCGRRLDRWWGSSVGGAGGGGLGTMQYLLILLVAVTMACGAAASVTIALVPAYADDSGKGY